MKKLEGGVTAARGFLAAGIHAGIKKKKKDIALVCSEVPAVAAGTFTTNIVKAAPVKWCQKVIKEHETVRAVVLNSGVANACTGAAGEKNNLLMAKTVAEHLHIDEEAVLTCSTGVIGKQLPMEEIIWGIQNMIPQLENSIEAGTLAAEAIMTTDTYLKEYAVEFPLNDKVVTIGGMAKGSGMIHPDMATMLGIITTDVSISQELLQEAVRNDVKDSFNMISVDRDTSTNDSLIVLANGLAENDRIVEKKDDYTVFCKALNQVTTHLAKMMAGDGEGATKLLEVEVTGARTKEEAAALSKSIIASNLVKTAVYGSDANWGRILCAMGYAGVEFDPDKVDLFIESKGSRLQLVKDGVAAEYREETATRILSEKKVKAIADIKMGEKKAKAWGCDLTYDYIKINGDYRS